MMKEICYGGKGREKEINVQENALGKCKLIQKRHFPVALYCMIGFVLFTTEKERGCAY